MADDKTKDKTKDTPEEAQEEKFNRDWLKGRKFHDAVPKKVKKDGREVRVYEPRERALKEEDVLAWKVRGNEVSIVTADGQKFTVNK